MARAFNIGGEWVIADTFEEAQQIANPRVPIDEVQAILGNPNLMLALKAREALPGSDVSNIQPAGAWDRFKAGFLSDTPEEQQAFYQEQGGPGRKTATVDVFGTPYTVYQDPNGQVRASNQPGMDWGDVAQGVGAGILPALTGVGAYLSGGSVPLAASLVAGSELAREGGQAAYGSQRETLPQYGTRAAISGGAEFLNAIPIMLGTGAANVAANRGTVSAAEAARHQAMLRGEQLGLGPHNWTRAQLSNNPVTQRIHSQTMQLSPEMGVYHANQMGRVADEAAQFLEGGRLAVPGAAVDPNAALLPRARAAYERMVTPSPSPSLPPNLSVGGDQITTAVKLSEDAGRAGVDQMYAGVQAAAARENPLLDIAPLQAMAAPRSVPGRDAAGNIVDVAVRPPGAMGQIMAQINQLDTLQTPEVVQEIRTRLGQLLDLDPATAAESGINLGQVKRMYAAASDAMRNPATPAPGYAALAPLASDTAEQFHRRFDLPQVKAALKARDTGEVDSFYRSLVRSPDGLSKPFLDVIEQAGPRHAARYRQTVLDDIATDPRGFDRWEALKRDSGEGFQWLTQDPSVRDTMEQVLRVRKALEDSTLREAFVAPYAKQDFASRILAERASSAPDARRLVNEMGGRGSPGHADLRQAVYERALTGAMKENKIAGREVLDPDKLGANISKIKESRQWSEILTPEDRDKLEALLGNAKTSWVGGDAGGGLVIAGLIRKLFSTRAHEAVGEISASRIFANILMSPRLNAGALRRATARGVSNRQAFSGVYPLAIGSMLTNIGAEIPLSEATTDLSARPIEATR